MCWYLKYKFLTLQKHREKNKDVVKDVVKELSDRQRIIVSLMNNDKQISAAELSQIINVNVRTVQREIATLEKTGVISRMAGRKSGYWKVNPDDALK